jgi:ribosomal protein L23
MSSLGNILIRPVISEKMTKQAERLGQYAFIVSEKANRIEIARAIENFYNVRVESVNTMRYEGKRRARITKKGVLTGRTNSYKKAVVTLRKGDTIDFFSNI